MMNSKREVSIDPRFWNADMDVTVNVGLGTGSRERDLVMLQRILQTQIMMADRFQASGAINEAIELLPKILATMVKMAEAAGIRNPEDFYPEYTEEKVAQLKALAAEKAKQPDPKVAMEMAKAKGDQEIAAGKAQADAQTAQAKMQAEVVQEQRRQEMETQRMQMDYQLKREQIAAEMGLKREQLNAELILKREQMIAELQLKRELGVIGAAAKVSASTSEVGVGGEPG
jgi:hypothetical protein